MLELVVVLTLGAVFTGMAAWLFGGYVQETSAQRAAKVFARDLTMARASALRAREPVVIRFYEGSRWYQVVGRDSGTEYVRRRFGPGADVTLDGIDLLMDADTVAFDRRGVVDLQGASGSLGEARFSAGGALYSVRFNGLGASRVEER